MNQILEYSAEKNNKAPKRGGSTSDKIVKFLAFFLMIFAIFLIGSGVYSLLKNKKDNENDNVSMSQPVNAEIDAYIDENTKKVVLSVSNEIELNKVIYNWNTKTEMTIDGEKLTSLEKEIDLPSGTNKLNVKVIDMEGNETKKTFTFESTEGTDIISPNITLTVSGKNLVVTATDETEIAYVTYRWNDDEEQTVKAEEEGQKEIIVELEIPKGKNSVTVVAVDASEKHNTKTETKALVGVTKPGIIVNLNDDGSALSITCTHENGIKEIYYTLNDKPYEYKPAEEEISTEVQFTQELDEGYNLINKCR